MKKKAIFIINPNSGVGRHKTVEKDIEKYFDTNIFEYKIIYTEYQGHAIEISKQAVTDNIDLLVISGGDGSINEVSQSLVNTNTVLGLIPTGSGNGLARFLEIPLQPHKAIGLLNTYRIKEIDTAEVNNKLFVSIAGVGFDALIAEKFTKVHRRGFFSYFSLITTAFTTYVPQEYTLTLDEKKIKRKALFISFANSNQFGYNTNIAPDAIIDDGKLVVTIVEKPPLILTPILAHLLFFKKINQSNYVEVIKSNNISIERKDNGVVNIDGEAIHINSKSLNFKIKNKSLKIIVPK